MALNSANKSSFLLEIGTEDLPARFIAPAMQQLKENTGKILGEHHLGFSEIRTYGTPRRLAVIADGIPLMQEDRSKEVFGPSRKVAFDADGNPTKAAIGFAQSQGIPVEKLMIRNKDKGEYVVALVEEKGVSVNEILPEIFKKIVFSLSLPKSMRWGDGTIRFVRPIRWLLSLFNNERISFGIEGIESSNSTKGHRFLSPASFQIKEVPSYRSLLGNNCVIVDPAERKRIIREKTEKLLTPSSERPVEDEELLDTVVNLVEYPVPVLAAFPDIYLALPKELLITVMKGHQKYFAVEDKNGAITNHFVVISNTSEENADIVRIGAERVIKARFEDARFYFEEDSKRPLADRMEDLRKVTFQESLGSLHEKAGRMASIASFLAERLLPSSEKECLVRAAWLSKTDLISGVVREFPELQGIMGKYYALHDREDPKVAEALEEHYLPTHSGGSLPQTDVGALLGIADKIDTITAFFSIGLIPTGSEDPFALRRQALGIIAIIQNRGYALPLAELTEKAITFLPPVTNAQEVKVKVLQFFENRLEAVFSDFGYASDIVQSILPLSLNIQLSDSTERLNAIRQFKEHKAFNDFLTAIKRINNIIPKQEIPALKEELLIEEQEKRLKEVLETAKASLAEFLNKGRIHDVFELLPSLTGPINAFFDNILVMDKREEIKLNRLSLLNEIWKAVSMIADFSKLSAV
jgi:glycyl-tRNA synthetase beta chain